MCYNDKTVTESVTPMLVVAGEAAGKDSTVDTENYIIMRGV